MKIGLISIFLTTIIIQSYGQFSPTAEYIASNKGKWTIEVPEVQELVHIIIAITPTGKSDKNMVQHNTQYYQQVIDHFEMYNHYKIVKKINQLLKKGRYHYVKMDACGFYFDEQNRIVKDKTYQQLNWSNKNFVEPFTSELEDFAKQTGFREFYRSHQEYYKKLIEMMAIQMPIDRQWKWLEDRFPNKYDSYKITFSPLVNGSHSTNSFETENFKQTIMFICGPIESQNLTEKIKEGLMTRVVFTEIDHNYVNPISDIFNKEIDRAFKDRSTWTSGKDSKNYGSPYSVFNEYMTWSVFTLYALDTFDENDFKTINERVELLMTEYRGFSKFKEFNQELVELYKNMSNNETIVECKHFLLR